MRDDLERFGWALIVALLAASLGALSGCSSETAEGWIAAAISVASAIVTWCLVLRFRR